MNRKSTPGIWRHLAATDERTQGGPTHPVGEVLPLSNDTMQDTSDQDTKTLATKTPRHQDTSDQDTKTLATKTPRH